MVDEFKVGVGRHRRSALTAQERLQSFFSWGVTRMDKTRNEYIRGTAQVEQFGGKERQG